LHIWVQVHAGFGTNSAGIHRSSEKSGSWSPHSKQKTPSIVHAKWSLPQMQIGSANSKSALERRLVRATSCRFAYLRLFHSK
jgi:hypothetical protein